MAGHTGFADTAMYHGSAIAIGRLPKDAPDERPLGSKRYYVLFCVIPTFPITDVTIISTNRMRQFAVDRLSNHSLFLPPQVGIDGCLSSLSSRKRHEHGTRNAGQDKGLGDPCGFTR